jgi:nucleoside-diphosphate-sugar epimerase
VDDLVAACVLVVDSDRAKGRAYNITSGESITSKAFFETVADRFELPRPTRALPYSAAWAIASAMTFAQSLRGHTTSYSPLKRLRLFGLPHHFSIERATDELGFGPEKRLQEALQCL